MDLDIVEGAIGNVGKYDIEFRGGNLVVEVTAKVAVGDAGLLVKVDSGSLIDAIKKAIPGVVDDAILEVIKAALKN